MDSSPLLLFLSHEVLSRVFRGKFVAALKSAFSAKQARLPWPENSSSLAQPKIFACLAPATLPPRLGRLLQTTLRRTRACLAVSRPLHPPCRHLQPPPGLLGGWPSHVSLARFRPSQPKVMTLSARSSCVASCFICFPRASSAFAISASSPTGVAPHSCHSVSPLSTPLHRKTNRKPRPLRPCTHCGSVPSAADHGRRRTIHSRTTPTPFSTAPGHGCMKSLAHTTHCRRTSERLAEVCLPCRAIPSSRPRVGSLPAPPRPSLCPRTPAPPTLTTPANFYPPRSLHSMHKSRVRRASGFLLTAFSNATPHTFFQP